MAKNLDLLVCSTVKNVIAHPRDVDVVSGAIEPAIFCFRDRELDVTLGGLLGIAPIAGRRLWAADKQLPDLSNGHRGEVLIDDERRQSGVWNADGDDIILAKTGRRFRIPPVHEAGYRQLGGAIKIFDNGVGCSCLPLFRRESRQRLAAK